MFARWTYSSVLLIALLCGVASCSKYDNPKEEANSMPPIFPDYINVTIPENIAPLNFEVKGAKHIVATISVRGKQEMKLSGESKISFPIKDWRKLLSATAGDKLDVTYVRYSDDILIIGNEWKKGYAILKESLAQKQLILNPKKVEILSKGKWFQFLGFSIKNDKISLSKKRIKTFQKEIEIRTIKSKHTDIDRITKNINDYLYTGDGVYSWATSVLPVINVEQDITTLNGFVMDAIRAAKTKKTNIGGLGYSGKNKNAVIVRGKGSNVKVNKEKIPFIANYKTIQCMKNALMIAKPLYQTLQS